MFLQEYRDKAIGLPDLLYYDRVIADKVVLGKDGSLIAGFYMRGPDTESASNNELEAISVKVNQALTHLGTNWMVHVDAVRINAVGYPEEGQFPDTTTRVMDEERRRQYEHEGAHFESKYAVIVTYLPPNKAEQNALMRLYEVTDEGDPVLASDQARIIEQFEKKMEAFVLALSGAMDNSVWRMGYRIEVDSQGRQLKYDELLAYLQYCITGIWQPILLSRHPLYLDSFLGAQDFVGGIEPKIGDNHIRVISIDGFPVETFPGILDRLNSLAVKYRWNSRFMFLDPYEAKSIINRFRKKWKQKIRGFKDQIMNTASGQVDLDALQMSMDAEGAMSEATQGFVRFGYYTSVVVLMDSNKKLLEESVEHTRKMIMDLGFNVRVETINAVEAYLGSLPGHGYHNVRRPIMHTLNLADMIPTTATWPGLEYNPCDFYPKKSPPLFHAATTGAAPFRFSLHIGDVGHTLVLGPTGAGKSTLLTFIMAQHQRYKNAQVFAFDKGYSAEILCKAAGGVHYDVAGDGSTLAFCPLANIGTPAEQAWAAEYIEICLALQRVDVTPKQRNEIHQALLRLAQTPSRTFTDLWGTLQDDKLRQGLEHYTTSGAMGKLLDAEADSLTDSRFQVFELEHLMNLGDKNVVPVLLYLFHKIEKQFDGSPTLLVLDEAWLMLSHPLFREKIREWLKVLRKANVAVVFATQSISDIGNSPIRDVIYESCPTKLLLPNPEARNEASLIQYKLIGLNDRQVDLIANATKKRDYYYLSPLGKRMFSLGLGMVNLAFVGSSGKEDLKKAREMMATYGDAWPAEWLRHKGVPAWADYWMRIRQ